ncbi:cytoplasmic protein [Deltaproteobacteria bacterium]|nr:cytoplasmic protein [Deltaproteobacteria bacterium]
MSKHSYEFVEEYSDLVGFGYDRKTDENTLIYYLQKFSDDKHAALILSRMSDSDMEELFNLIGGLLKKHLTEEEYHSQFLKEDD